MNYDMEDEITAATVIARDGQVVQPQTREALERTAEAAR